MILNKQNKILFLDWNGTLSNSFFWEHMRLSKDPSVKSLYERWDTCLFCKPKEYIQGWMRGEYSTESVLKELATETDTKYEVVLKEFITGCKAMKFVSEDIPVIVKDLQKAGYYVLIATNNMDCFTRWTVSSMKLHLLFDEILNSFYLKGLKHEEIGGKSVFFENIFTKYDVIPKNCIFIDDSADKNGYIENLGIKYIQIKDSTEFLSVLESLLTRRI